MVQRVKSQSWSLLCIYVCVCERERERERERDRDKWASLCDRQRRDSVTLYITSLPYPDAHIHTRQRGRGCTATADRKQGCSSPLYISPSQPTCLHSIPYVPLFKLTPLSSDFLIPGSLLVTALSICGRHKLTVLRQRVTPNPAEMTHDFQSISSFNTKCGHDLLIEDSNGLILCCYCWQRLKSATAHRARPSVSQTHRENPGSVWPALNTEQDELGQTAQSDFVTAKTGLSHVSVGLKGVIKFMWNEWHHLRLSSI